MTKCATPQYQPATGWMSERCGVFVQVALMFLTRGDMPHEASWRAWLSSVEGLVPIDAAQSTLCRRQQLQCYTPSVNSLPHVTKVSGDVQCVCLLAWMHACMHALRA